MIKTLRDALKKIQVRGNMAVSAYNSYERVNQHFPIHKQNLNATEIMKLVSEINELTLDILSGKV